MKNKRERKGQERDKKKCHKMNERPFKLGMPDELRPRVRACARACLPHTCSSSLSQDCRGDVTALAIGFPPLYLPLYPVSGIEKVCSRTCSFHFDITTSISVIRLFCLGLKSHHLRSNSLKACTHNNPKVTRPISHSPTFNSGLPKVAQPRESNQ